MVRMVVIKDTNHDLLSTTRLLLQPY